MIRHLYVHVPFCPRICPYCSFYKVRAAEGGFDAFVEAVLREAALRGKDAQPESVFFGGGTPTALGRDHLRRLITGLRDLMDFSLLREFTIEMNPATVSPAKAELLLDLGVNRASMGVQSWNATHLKTLGRSHSPAAALKSLRALRAAGFQNLNLDLIFGIPGQSLEDWRETLETTIAQDPEHVSAYSLTYEEDTAFFESLKAGKFSPDAGLDADQFELAAALLKAAGYPPYEISNYARPGRECLHNFAIWQGADFLGLGPSAVSTLRGTRSQNIANTRVYEARCEAGESAVDFSEALKPRQIQLERVALGLRTSRGIPETLADATSVRRLFREGLIEKRGSALVLTRRGRLVADDVALALAD